MSLWKTAARKLFGSDDLDDIFAYKTVRMVIIRDRRLGLLSTLCMFGIVVFVVLQLAMNGTYLTVTPVSGTSRYLLVQPTSTCTFKEREEGKTGCTECDPNQDNCYDKFPRVQNLPYCNQSTLPFQRTRVMCRFQESAAVQAVFQSSMLVATMGQEINQTKECSADPDAGGLYHNGTCDRVYKKNEQGSDIFFFADVEKFTIGIFHSLASPVVRSGTQMTGGLHITRSNRLCTYENGAIDNFPYGKPTDSAPCWITPNKTQEGIDEFTLEILLEAAGINLDDDSYAGSNTTLREDGTSIAVNIKYSNWNNWQVVGFTYVEPRYEYEVVSLKNNSFHHTEAIYDNYPSTRTLLKRWGIRFVSVQSGNLREFSIMEFLITLTTSLTLVTVTTVVVDIIATSVMTDSSLYKDYKMCVTPDISEVRDGRRCATCNNELHDVYSDEAHGGYCGICEGDFVTGTRLFRCIRCGHDRCEDCLLCSTTNKPPATNIASTILDLYDTEKKGSLSYDQFIRFVLDVAGSGAQIPTRVEYNSSYLSNYLRELTSEERDKARSILNKKRLLRMGSLNIHEDDMLTLDKFETETDTLM